ncbi:MAG: HEAT repeat domain-containing protein [Candidatus Methanoperedens sp.]|nr:HEAT repeat domain-containing protein [Candidatus Methanoperedens sp.]CAG0975325.1 Phycocyanobilin lyase subunit alpha [Methanosarcinales archaeon]
MPLDYTDLREMKKRQDIEGLLNILETGDIKECREAIRMLGELRTRKAVSPLLGFLETDDVHIRSNAAWSLGEIGHVKAVLPLIGLLNDPVENVRINAAWSLGRIGDKRALSVLRSAMKNGSTDLRKHAREAIARIESNEKDKWREDADIPDIVDIPLIEIEVPSNMECNYISRVEDADSQTDYENLARFSRNVQIRDTGDSFSEEDTRKIVLGLKDDSKGLVSVDIIFKYKDNTNGEKKSSSVWLQMANVGTNGDHKTEREIERIDSRPKRRTAEGSKRIAKIKRSRRPKPVEYDIPDEAGSDQLEKYPSEIDDTDIEEYPEERAKKIITRREKRPVVREIPEEQEYGYEEETQEIPELTRPEPKLKETRPEPKLKETKPEVQAAPPKIPDKPKPEPEIKTEIVKEKVTPEIKPPVEAVIAKPATVPTAGGNVNSAVKLLSNIGMSGMTNAASTVTQLGGEEAESKHSQLRTIPIEEMNDEITGLGDSVVMISVELHGNGQEGEVKGEMQMYISSQNALEIANELLCNTPDTAIKKFNDDITSTLKETANIYGGQYISAISEYIGVPLSLKAPSFKTGQSSQVAESVLKDITGKVEFALATNIEFGNNRIGRLIMLVDPKSFDIIISKLF